MVSFIHISDPHFNMDYSSSWVSRISDKTGVTLTEQFAASMSQINRSHPDADFFLLSGDIVHEGTACEYAEFRRLMQNLSGGRPCYAAVGNHDTDDFWRGWFGETGEGACDYTVTDSKSGLKIISLDSRGGPYGSGDLSPAQLEWLRVAVSDDRPCILMLHHTPHTGNIEYLTYQMQNAQRLYNVIYGSGVLGIFTGHTHLCFGYIICELIFFRFAITFFKHLGKFISEKFSFC